MIAPRRTRHPSPLPTMTFQTLLTISSSVVLSTAACWFVLDGRSPQSEMGTTRALSELPDVSRVQAELDAMSEQVEGLLRDRDVNSLPMPRVAATPSVDSDTTQETLAALVRDLVKEEALVAPVREASSWPGGHTTVNDAIRAILEGGVVGQDMDALWEEAAANGQLHELLAAMEEELSSTPDSADKEFDRARAYYAAAQAMPSNTNGNWWVDSNDAYSAALEHDPQHWDARYQKAKNMAFWPVAYGGQAEAVRHFEILADQQESGSATGGSKDSFPTTYVWLGNLYAQQGKTDAARAAWQRGLNEFPGHGWLLERLGTLE